MPSSVKVFATTGSDGLARDICASLAKRLPKKYQKGSLTLSPTEVKRFSNDNILVKADDVRDRMVVIIHTQVPPVNDHLIELFALIDAINNARPADLLLVFPYMPYARSDRKNESHISTMGNVLPCILTTALEVKRVILLDPHDSHLKHYFKPAADEITSIYLLVDYLENRFLVTHPKKESVVVFADSGSAKRFQEIAYLVKLRTAYIDKDRPNHEEEPQFNRVVGEVENMHCILVDDEILTGRTVIGDAQMLFERGAKSVSMVAVHAVVDDNKTSASHVLAKLEESPIESIIVTDSIPTIWDKMTESSKLVVLTVASLLAEAIKRTVLGESLTALRSIESVELYRE